MVLLNDQTYICMCKYVQVDASMCNCAVCASYKYVQYVQYVQYGQVGSSMCKYAQGCPSRFKYVQVRASMCKEQVTASGCFFPHRKMPVPQCPTVPHSTPQCPQVPHPQMLGCCLFNIFLVAILKVKALPSSLLIVTMYVMSSVCLQWEFWESTV